MKDNINKLLCNHLEQSLVTTRTVIIMLVDIEDEVVATDIFLYMNL